MRVVLAAGLVVAVVGLSEPVRAVVINFDDLDASAGPVIVASQYSAEGVIFDGLAVIEALPGQASSVPNAGVINDEAPFNLLVIAIFSSDMDSVSAFFSDTEVGSQLVIKRAFDAGGTEVDVATVVTPTSESQIVSLSASGIRSVTLETDADGTLFDDFTFTAEVPEPDALALLVVGLTAIVSFRRRRKAS